MGQDLLRSSVELAREFGVGWHTHCSEGSIDPEIYLDVYGIRPATWLAEEGLLGEDATLAHGIWFDDAEIEQIGATRSGVSYNPVSNEYIGNGVARLRDLRQAGASVGLGTDGVAVTGQDMFECMKQSVLLQRGTPGTLSRPRWRRRSSSPPVRVLGTRASMPACWRPAAGRRRGASTCRRPHPPVHRTVATLVYSAVRVRLSR